MSDSHTHMCEAVKGTSLECWVCWDVLSTTVVLHNSVMWSVAFNHTNFILQKQCLKNINVIYSSTVKPG